MQLIVAATENGLAIDSLDLNQIDAQGANAFVSARSMIQRNINGAGIFAQVLSDVGDVTFLSAFVTRTNFENCFAFITSEIIKIDQDERELLS